MRRLAIRSVLSAKAADGRLQVIDTLAIDTPRTKELRSVLAAAGFDRGALVVTAQPDAGVKRSVHNLPKVKWMPAAYLNVLDLLSHRGLLMTEDAVRAVEALWGGERAAKRKTPAAAEAAATEGTDA
jgi:large subunit ribosomal protein L4